MTRAPRLGLALLATAVAAACVEEILVVAETPYPQRFAVVAAGNEHTCATTPEGRTFCWGNPAHSRLAHTGQTTECDDVGCRQPIPIRENHPFTSLDAGEAHTCGLVEQRVYCWGFNRFGQLGDDRTVLTNCWDDLPFLCSIDPRPVAIGTPLALVTAARMHSCALALDGRAVCWGWNIAGQLGRGYKDLEPHPEPAVIDGDQRFVDLSTAFGHTCGLTADGAAYCWGSNEFGLLGTGDLEQRSSPAAVVGGHSFVRIEGGGHFTCGLTASGEIWCWGWGWEGRLGTGNMNDQLTPARNALPEPASEISAGQHHACAIGVSGALYCWGNNYDGQLGVSGLGFRISPEQVPLPVAVVSVSAGYLHTCAITADERLYCWGDNSHRQLGFGDEPYRDVPVPVNP